MNVRVLRSSEQKVSRWSGGTGFQLDIFPKNSDYVSLDFIFRISSAQVEVEESDFTVLSGYNRKLMVLEGNVTLQFRNIERVILNPLETVEFDGAWNTKSFGKCTDFNLMTNSEAHGTLDYLVLKPGDNTEIAVEKELFYLGIYNYKGNIVLGNSKFNEELFANDFIAFENNGNPNNIQIQSKENSILIISKIWKSKG